MVTRVLLLLWPALLPLLAFLLWHMLKKRSATKRGEVPPLLKDGPWYRITLATIAIAVLCFFIGGLWQDENKGTYVPAHMENGVLHPGRIQP